MEIIDKQTIEALNWLRFVLNPETAMPTVTDWAALYRFADKQAIIGICNPTRFDVKIGIEILSLWIGDLQQIQLNSTRLNKRVEELGEYLGSAGFSFCILKGQGNAEMYPEPLMRMPGDIDVWIDADEEVVYKYVKNRFPDAKVFFKHICFPLFNDVQVEVHATPHKFFCPLHNKRTQRWIEKNKEEQFKHKIHLTGIENEICVPTVNFNAVFQLGHLLLHLYDEGFGLRHLVDYYYVLKNLEFSVEERDEFEKTLEHLGMLRFAKSIMWIEKEILGLPE